MRIPNYSTYEYVDNKIINTKTGKEVTLSTTSKSTSPYCKLKNDSGVWNSVSLSKIHSLCYPPKAPEGFKLVPGYERTFISRDGIVWLGPQYTNVLGTYAAITTSEGSYPQCRTEKDARYIHILLALTFLDKDYLEKGLCVMHLDDNKTNYKLSNLKVSTYSENNKAAYDTGVNPSKNKGS